MDHKYCNADAILGGLDLYSIDANNELYIDDVIFAEGSLGADDFNAAVFSVYPNPVVNTLNIKLLMQYKMLLYMTYLEKL